MRRRGRPVGSERLCAAICCPINPFCRMIMLRFVQVILSRIAKGADRPRRYPTGLASGGECNGGDMLKTMKRLLSVAAAAMLCMAPCAAMAATSGIRPAPGVEQRAQSASLSVRVQGDVELHMLENGAWRGLAPGDDTASLATDEAYPVEAHVADGQRLASVTLNGEELEFLPLEDGNVWTFTIPEVDGDCFLMVATAPAGQEMAFLSVSIQGDAQLQMLENGVWRGIAPGDDTAALVMGETYSFQVHVENEGMLEGVYLDGEALDFEAEDSGTWTFTIGSVAGDADLVIRTQAADAESARLSVSMEGDAQLHLRDGDQWVGIVPGEDTADLGLGGRYLFQVHVGEGQMLSSLMLNGAMLACAYDGDNTWRFAIDDVVGDCHLAISTAEGEAGRAAALGVQAPADCDVQLAPVEGEWSAIESGEGTATLATGQQYQMRVVTPDDQALVGVNVNGTALPFSWVNADLQDHLAWELLLPITTESCNVVLTVDTVANVRRDLAFVAASEPSASVIAVPVPEGGGRVDVELACEPTTEGGMAETMVVWGTWDARFQFKLVRNEDGSLWTANRCQLPVSALDLGYGGGRITVTAMPLTRAWIGSDPTEQDVLAYLNNYEAIGEGIEMSRTWTVQGVPAVAFPILALPTGSPLAVDRQTGYVRGLEATGSDADNAASKVVDVFWYNQGMPWQIVDALGQPLPAESRVRTGCRLRIEGAENAPSATFVVQGDVLGLGAMNLLQLVRMADAYKGTSPLDGPYLAAGDFSGSGRVDLVDLVEEAALYRSALEGAK